MAWQSLWVHRTIFSALSNCVRSFKIYSFNSLAQSTLFLAVVTTWHGRWECLRLCLRSGQPLALVHYAFSPVGVQQDSLLFTCSSWAAWEAALFAIWLSSGSRVCFLRSLGNFVNVRFLTVAVSECCALNIHPLELACLFSCRWHLPQHLRFKFQPVFNVVFLINLKVSLKSQKFSCLWADIYKLIVVNGDRSVCMPRCSCGAQKMACRRQLSPSTRRMPGLNVSCQAWQQAPLPTGPSHHSMLDT